MTENAPDVLKLMERVDTAWPDAMAGPTVSTRVPRESKISTVGVKPLDVSGGAARRAADLGRGAGFRLGGKKPKGGGVGRGVAPGGVGGGPPPPPPAVEP